MIKTKKQDESQVFAEVAPLIMKAYQVMTSDPEECIRIARSALTISKRQSFRRGIAQAYMHIGLGKYHQGELAAALEEYRLAEEMFFADKDYLGLRSVYNNIGIIYCQWRDRDRALEYYQKNLELEDKCTNPKLSCTILVNIGNIHLWSNDYAAARECYDKALKLAKESGNDYGEGLAYNQIGYLLKQQKRWDEAVDYLNRSYEVRIRNNDLNGVIKIHLNLADISQLQNNVEEALEQNRTAMQLARQLKDKNSIAIAALNFAGIFKQMGDRDGEKENLELCLSLASEQGYRNLEVNALRELAQWHERAGDYENALKTYWLYQDAKNYLIDLERNHKVQELRIQMQVAEKEREMRLVRASNLALEKKNRTIVRQKNKLEKAEKALTELNRNLEHRVREELEKLRKQEQIIIQKSKLESLGRLSAGIAHEINQPLGMINLGLQNLFNKLGSGQASPAYLRGKEAYFRENIERIKRIIEHVRLFSRDQQDEKLDRADLREIVSGALSMIKLQCKNQNIRLEFETPRQPLYIFANKYRLEQVVLNLLANARDAVEAKFDPYDDNKLIRVRSFQSGDVLVLEVEDNGGGIAEQDLQKIFDPFFTTKNERQGTGLGLSICYGIVQELGGSISCRSAVGEGTVMRIELKSDYLG